MVAWREELVAGWGGAVGGVAEVARPVTVAEIRDVLSRATREGFPVALRGAGCSYGDAAMNTGGRVLDLAGMDRMLEFDPVRGIARVEPGVRIRDLWKVGIRHGWWPAVVPGTMEVSIGGAAAMNVHGKNNYSVGSFGEHVLGFTMIAPSGELLECDRTKNADVFHAAISGFGMLGCFTEVTLRLKKVHSGRLRCWAIPTPDLERSVRLLEENAARADYLVGWIDLHARGRSLGRGLLHRGDLLEPGEDPEGEDFLRPDRQEVPRTLFHVVPKSWIWPAMWAAYQLRLTGFINAAKWRAGFREERHSPYLQTHGAFHFLLDYVPRWQWMLKPGGLIQFQPFVPAAASLSVFRAMIETSHRAGFHPYLGVLKKHRPDPFLMTHAVDGYSLAMEFGVSTNPRKRRELWEHTHRLADIVLDAGGRFYYAKDATLLPHAFERVHGTEAVARFRTLKSRLDPTHVLQTDLSRRIMADAPPT
jgi:decaprenylphospho-beta-D-ribofuranose 2-oxidase